MMMIIIIMLQINIEIQECWSTTPSKNTAGTYTLSASVYLAYCAS